MGYALAGMRFNSVSTHHTSDTFHVCYEVMSVNMVEPRCAMRDDDRQNTGKSVDRGSVTERSVAGAVERSDIRKNKGKIAISSHEFHHARKAYCRFRICLPHPKTTTSHHQPSATTHAFAWHSQHKTSIQQVSTTCLLGCPGVTMEFGTLFCKDEKKKSAPKFHCYLRAP